MSERLYGKYNIFEWMMYVEGVRFNDVTENVSLKVDELDSFLIHIRELGKALDEIVERSYDSWAVRIARKALKGD